MPTMSETVHEAYYLRNSSGVGNNLYVMGPIFPCKTPEKNLGLSPTYTMAAISLCRVGSLVGSTQYY